LRDLTAGATASATIAAGGESWPLAGLTAEQREAVCHGERPLLIVAGPGTGKTHTLTYRIAWLLVSGLARPWEILAVTFSVRAADELRLRLVDMLGVELAGGVRAATFHSVCARILREHACLFGRSGEYTVYDQTEVRRTIDWLISERQRGELADAVVGLPAAGEIQREIAKAKNRLLSPAHYERSATHRAAALIGGVWRELDAEMQRLDAMDFDDLLLFTVRLLAGHPHVLLGLRERWRWVLIDEVQDSCPAQLELAVLLAGPDGNLTAVGDPDQVIYGFRQADPHGMRRLSERFPGHRQVYLSRNRRSRAEILGAAVRCVQHNPGRDARAMLALRGSGGQVATVAFASERDEAVWIARAVAETLNAGTQPMEVLLLAHTSFATKALQAEFARAGIPHRVLGSLGLYERAEVRTALSYLTLLANPRDARAFSRAVSAPRRGIGERTQSMIVALARERHSGDLIRACCDDHALAFVASSRARGELERFAVGLDAAGTELRDGRSLSHVAIAVLTHARRDRPLAAVVARPGPGRGAPARRRARAGGPALVVPARAGLRAAGGAPDPGRVPRAGGRPEPARAARG
jgi:DNA helicase-2/ATP-dependent DNA helicase PcrA